jgi:hypothetical protein
MDRQIQIHEKLYLLLGSSIAVALFCEAISSLLTAWAGLDALSGLCVALGTVAYLLVLRRTRCGGGVRVIAAYLATWALYSGSSSFVEWMGMTRHGEQLAAFDQRLFGQTPAEFFHGRLAAWQLDLLSLGYMSYHLYLHWVLLDSLSRDDTWRRELSARLFLAFGLGFIGYYLFPAAPPDDGMLGLASRQLEGGFLTQANEWINARMAARYDAFPSLHVLITATLLSWDWNQARWRFRIMLVPSLLMLVATLALRLHYVVDLLASLVLFVILSLFHARKHTPSCRTLGA